MAIGALLAARELGYRVPEDLSVIGIDGHELGEFFRLTTVDQFPLGQGERAADAILEELEPRDSDAPPHQPGELPYELIVRGSTARLLHRLLTRRRLRPPVTRNDAPGRRAAMTVRNGAGARG